MCGRYVSPDKAAIERHWHVGRQGGNPFDRRFNVAPTTTVPILRWDAASGGMELVPAVWGLIPPWWKEAKPPRYSFNARSEEGANKPMWRTPLKSSRCLVPAEGWYEWRQVETTDPQTGKIRNHKQPYYIHSATGRIFAFAGVMSCSGGAEDTPESISCAILTTAAAPSVVSVHDRMPVVLADAACEGWLDPGLNVSARAVEYAVSHAFTDFAFHPVSTRVNVAKNNDLQLTDAVR